MTPPPGPVGADPRRGRVAFGAAVVVIAGGLTYLGVAPQHWLRGVLVVAAGLVFAGLARAALPDRIAGPLRVRRRWVDAATYLVVGVAVAAFGVMVR